MSLKPGLAGPSSMVELYGSLYKTWRAINEQSTDEGKIKAIAKYLNCYNISTSFANIILSSYGYTDITLICPAPGLCKFVFKVMDKNQFRVARVNSLVLKLLGMSAPDMYSITDQDGAKAFFSKFAKRYNGRDSSRIKSVQKTWQKKSQVLCWMKAFEGAPLGDAIKFNKFAHVSLADMERIWHEIGKTALFDLVCGNDDRFFRLQYDAESQTVSFVDGFINPGNFMLNISMTGGLSGVYLIDNVSFNHVNGHRSQSDYPEIIDRCSQCFLSVIDNNFTIDGLEHFSSAVLSGLQSIGMPLCVDVDNSRSILEQGIIEGICAINNNGDDVVTNFTDLISAEGPEESLLGNLTVAHLKQGVEIIKSNNILELVIARITRSIMNTVIYEVVNL